MLFDSIKKSLIFSITINNYMKKTFIFLPYSLEPQMQKYTPKIWYLCTKKKKKKSVILGKIDIQSMSIND